MNKPHHNVVMFYVLLVRAFGMWDHVVSLYGSPSAFIKRLYLGHYVGFSRLGHMYITDKESWLAEFINGEWVHN